MPYDLRRRQTSAVSDTARDKRSRCIRSLAGTATLLAGMLVMFGARAAPSSGVTVRGTLEPRSKVVVGSYLSGVVQEVTCDFNDVVKKGQVCAKIDARRFQRSLARARAAVATAESQLEFHRAEFTYAAAKLTRNQALVERGVVSRDVYESLVATRDKLVHQVAVDTATIAQRKAEVDLALVDLEYADIVAPIDGVVLSRNVSAGETLQASLRSPVLFVIAGDLHALHLVASIQEVELGLVRAGETATFTVKARPDRTFTGRIAQVRHPVDSHPADGQTTPVRFDVVLDVDNPDLLLSPGMSAEVRFGPNS